MKRARRELVTLRVMCTEGRSQQPPVTSGSAATPAWEVATTSRRAPRLSADGTCLLLMGRPGGIGVTRNREPGEPRTDDIILAGRLGHQLWVKGTARHPRKLCHRIPVLCLLGTGAGGGSHMSMKVWRSLRRWGAVHDKPYRRSGDLSHAAKPAQSGVHSVRMCGSATIPRVFYPGNHVRNATVRIGLKLLYWFSIGASIYRTHQIIFDFVQTRT